MDVFFSLSEIWNSIVEFEKNIKIIEAAAKTYMAL